MSYTHVMPVSLGVFGWYGYHDWLFGICWNVVRCGGSMGYLDLGRVRAPLSLDDAWACAVCLVRLDDRTCCRATGSLEFLDYRLRSLVFRLAREFHTFRMMAILAGPPLVDCCART